MKLIGTAALNVRVDQRLRLEAAAPKHLIASLKKRFRHTNPEFGKKKRMGYSTWGTPRYLETWRQEEDGTFSFPRGGTDVLRQALSEFGFRPRWFDQRFQLEPVEFPVPRLTLRPYQREALAICVSKEQGIVRAPTGSGKTTLGLALLAELKQPALIVMASSSLLKQWRRRVEAELGIPPSEIGMIGGGKRRIGPRITLGLQQTLNSKKFDISEFRHYFGAVLIDECHQVAAQSFIRTADELPARYRIGVSADERRKDRKECLIYDVMGPVIHETKREELEATGAVLPITVRLVPTEFSAHWYVNAPPEERDFGALMEDMACDDDRNDVIVRTVQEALSEGSRPVIVFTRRREHARHLSDERLFARKIKTGLMLGGAADQARYDEDLTRLNAGKLDAAVGTVEAVGTGIDVPRLRSGVMALPLGNNPFLFNQVRGRICRPFKGKRRGYLYWLWDKEVWPDAPRKIRSWAGDVEEWGGTGWVPWGG